MAKIYDVQKIMHEIRPRTAEVVSVERGPMIRVTLQGADLESFSAPGHADHFKIFLSDSPLTFTKVDGRFRPMQAAVSRDLTPLVHAGDQLIFDVAEHETGPLIEWARTVKLGAQVSLIGPRGSRLLPQAPRYLLAADESALPALRRTIEATSAEARIDVVLQSPSVDARAYLADVTAGRNITLHQVSSANTVDCLAAIDPDESTYAWLAGEASWLIEPRRWLRKTSRLVPENIRVSGYWKVGVAGRDHHAPIEE